MNRTGAGGTNGSSACTGQNCGAWGIMAPGHGTAAVISHGPTVAPDTDTAAMRGIAGMDPDAPRVQRAITVPDFQT